MKKLLINFLKVSIPLAFGVFLIWYVFSGLTDKEEADLYASLETANYSWIVLSMVLGVLSHCSRAVRWKYTIETIGKPPLFWNSFFTVMIGYVANFAFPRLGEVTRPGLLAKYEGLPFNKLFGTIIAERIADLIMLAAIILTVIVLEFDLLRDMLMNLYEESNVGFSAQDLIVVLLIAVVGGGVFFFFMLSRSKNPFFVKVRNLFYGFMEGLKSILVMKHKWKFIVHTFLIWVLYIGMFYVCCFSLEETTEIPLAGILAGFVMGSISIVLVQGGIGVFPLAVMETLILYGITKTSALALGWIMWSSQTIMLIVVGILSIPLLRWYNRNNKVEKAD